MRRILNNPDNVVDEMDFAYQVDTIKRLALS
jgi:hypothetical protein